MMKSLTLVGLVPVLLGVAQASTLVTRKPGPAFGERSLNHLFARQETNVCDSECAVFSNALDACQTLGCFCTTSVALSLNRCVNCFWEAAPTPGTLTSINDLIAEFDSACAAFDYPPVVVTTDIPGPTSVTLPVPPSGTDEESSTSSSTSRSTQSSTRLPSSEPTTGFPSVTPGPSTTRSSFDTGSTSRPSQVTILPSDLPGNGGGIGSIGDDDAAQSLSKPVGMAVLAAAGAVALFAL